MRTVGASRSWERRGNRFSPEGSRSNQPWPHLDFSPAKPTLNHDYKKDTFVMFKPLSLWSFVTAAIRMNTDFGLNLCPVALPPGRQA